MSDSDSEPLCKMVRKSTRHENSRKRKKECTSKKPRKNIFKNDDAVSEDSDDETSEYRDEKDDKHALKDPDNEKDDEHELKDTDDEHVSEESRDMDDVDVSMFASVWVKIEVDEGHDLRPSTRKQRAGEGNVGDSKSLNATKSKGKRKRPPPQKTLICDQCDYRTGYKNCFELHLMGHSNTKPYACTFCPYKTKYPASLQRHTFIQHECKSNEELAKTLPTFDCPDCDYKTHVKWNLKAHRRKHSLEKKYKCEYCEYTTAYRHNHVKHKRVHNKDDVTYQCDKCPFVTKYEGHISRHLAQIHKEVSEKANKCDNCTFSTKKRWRLNIHRNRSRQEKILKCPYCDFESFYMCEFKSHKLCHYAENKSKWIPIKAEEMPNFYKNQDSGQTEQESQVSENSQLDIDFNMQSQHEKDNHYVVDPTSEIEWSSIPVIESLDQERPFLCTLCNYASKFKASVQRHYQRHHHKNRPYRCINCDFTTKTKDQITLHNKRSKSETVNMCHLCPYKTNFKCTFIMHQRQHYPFKCPDCSYTCRQKYDMQRHYSTAHLGSGLKCRYCDYKASRKESLLCHEAIHTGSKPFQCPYCPYKTVRQSLLDVHMRRLHGERLSMKIIDDSKIQSLKVVDGDKDSFMGNFVSNDNNLEGKDSEVKSYFESSESKHELSMAVDGV